MGKLKPKIRKPKSDLTRPVALGDLEALVRALGAIVGAAVDKAVREQMVEVLKDLDGTLNDLNTKCAHLLEDRANERVIESLHRSRELAEAQRDLGPGNAVR